MSILNNVWHHICESQRQMNCTKPMAVECGDNNGDGGGEEGTNFTPSVTLPNILIMLSNNLHHVRDTKQNYFTHINHQFFLNTIINKIIQF